MLEPPILDTLGLSLSLPSHGSSLVRAEGPKAIQSGGVGFLFVFSFRVWAVLERVFGVFVNYLSYLGGSQHQV